MMSSRRASGFTLIELLIVIVIIAILAAVTIVAYNGIQAHAYEASARSDISASKKLLSLYYTQYGNYPQDIAATNGKFLNSHNGTPSLGSQNCVSPGSIDVSNVLCLPGSNGAFLSYQVTDSSGSGYKMVVGKGMYGYQTTDSTSVDQRPCTPASGGVQYTCPNGLTYSQ